VGSHYGGLAGPKRRSDERFLFGFGNCVTTLGGLIMFMWDTQGISPQVIMSWRSSLHMRHDMELCDQGGEDQDEAWLDGPVAVWRASRRLWSKKPRVTVKLEQDLALMDQHNGEEQVRSRLMSQYGRMMIWSGSYHLVIGWCMCCINIEGDGMECARQRYNLGHFISLVIGV
jgi:hypothetical protein